MSPVNSGDSIFARGAWARLTAISSAQDHWTDFLQMDSAAFLSRLLLLVSAICTTRYTSIVVGSRARGGHSSKVAVSAFSTSYAHSGLASKIRNMGPKEYIQSAL